LIDRTACEEAVSGVIAHVESLHEFDLFVNVCNRLLAKQSNPVTAIV